MKQLVVLSGKGGTGKTSVVAAYAHLASLESRIVLADADVDAANLGLVLAPREIERNDFVAGKEAQIDPGECIACGRCAEVCRFDAVVVEDGAYRIDPLGCEGCASCYYQCPAEAVVLRDRLSGLWFHAETRFGHLFHAHLYAGQENSGKLVTMVKQQAVLWGAEHAADLILVDGPPGIGCPVIAACAGADLALLVVEPTVSGVHDLERILATTQHFGVPAAVVINKADINFDQVATIEAYCAEQGIPAVGRIPFDTVVTEAMVQGQPVTVHSANQVTEALTRSWRAVYTILARTR